MIEKNYIKKALIEYFELSTLTEIKDFLNEVDTEEEYIDYDGQEIRCFHGDDEIENAFKEIVSQCLWISRCERKHVGGWAVLSCSGNPKGDRCRRIGGLDGAPDVEFG